MRIACLQTNPQENLEENVSKIFETCRLVARERADLIVLPEMFAYMGPDAGRISIATNTSGGIFHKISLLAKELSIPIVGGSHPESSPDPNRVFNTAITVDATGTIISRYRKIHLFNLWGSNGEKLFCESDTFCPGETAPGFNLPINKETWRTQVGICYDLRFPELFRCPESRTNPLDLIVLPAAFTHATGSAHWETLIRARAIENQCFIAACNQTGFFQQGSKRNFGHSMVVSPWGEIVAKLQDEVGVLWADINRDAIETTRKKLPAYRNRVLA